MLNTNQKVKIARIISLIIKKGRSMFGLPLLADVSRGGVRWSLDLKEGIDLSIYVLGGFEVQSLKRYRHLVKEGSVVLDIGANIGAHTLHFARLVGSTGKVIAIEPTAYAFEKLQRNINLNPQLSARIESFQVMLTANSSDQMPDTLYASWPMETADDLHNEHFGRLMSTKGAVPQTLDDLITGLSLPKIDFIKMDVDGNEHSVLGGGSKTLNRFKPIILMELAPFVYKDHLNDFDKMIQELWEMGYAFYDMRRRRKIPNSVNAVKNCIPSAGVINVFVFPEATNILEQNRTRMLY
jgi:FkbM family methyltransferase